MVEVRKRGGEYTQVGMGCKDTNTCENQRQQNFQGGRPGNYQCKVGELEKYGPSVCRQCCNTPYCTGNEDASGMFWIPETKWQWSQSKPNASQMQAGYGDNNPYAPTAEETTTTVPTTTAPTTTAPTTASATTIETTTTNILPTGQDTTTGTTVTTTTGTTATTATTPTVPSAKYSQ